MTPQPVSAGVSDVVGVVQCFEEVVCGPGETPETAEGMCGSDRRRGDQFSRAYHQRVIDGGRVGVFGPTDAVDQGVAEAVDDCIDHFGGGDCSSMTRFRPSKPRRVRAGRS